jgi:tol-pal system protein YbgF
VAEIQRRQKDISQGVDDRLRQFEPNKVAVDGREFMAEPAEKRDFEAALAVFRKGDFSAAQTVFLDFFKRYPQSGYGPSALFWLGNAQYATRNYKEAVINFRALIARAPEHLRAPEAVLSIANCQIELKDTRGARKTLEDLIKAYPQSEAALAARERLARLK